MIAPDTTTCAACGRRYAFKNIRDRCPYCCTDQVREDDDTDDYDQTEPDYDGDD